MIHLQTNNLSALFDLECETTYQLLHFAVFFKVMAHIGGSDSTLSTFRGLTLSSNQLPTLPLSGLENDSISQCSDSVMF